MNINTQKYGALLLDVLPAVIHTEEENEQMLARVAALMKKGEENLSPEEQKLLELMSVLVERFEEKAYPFEKTTPLENLKFLLEESGKLQKDLLPVFGSKGIVSEVLSGKRGITAKHARQLGDFFKVSPELFV